VLWFRSDSNEAELCAHEWEELVDPLPELFDLPRGSRLGVSVIDKSGDAVTLCVWEFRCVQRLTCISKINTNLLEVILLNCLRSRKFYQNDSYDCIRCQRNLGTSSQHDSIKFLMAISDPRKFTKFFTQFFKGPTQYWRL
jgi:hypothetical protein